MKVNQHEQLFTELTAEFEAPAFTELDDETGAAIQGGYKLELYDTENFGQRLGSFDYGGKKKLIADNKISSIVVNDGLWRFYEKPNYKGAAYTLGKGAYKLGPGSAYLNNQISSFQQVG
jgi:hypothetical protein